MFTETNKSDRSIGCCHSGQGTTTLGMTIKLGDDDRSDRDTLFKGKGLICNSLANCRIHNEDHLIRGNNIHNLLHFFEKLSLLLVTTRSINKNNLVALLAKMFGTLLCKFDWVSLKGVTKVRNTQLDSVLLHLIQSSCTEGITAHHGSLPALTSPIVGKFGNRGGLTSTLETNEHKDVCLALDRFVRLHVRRQQSHKLVENSIANLTGLCS
mmetsp:Transcript_12329/g.23950  ORF Transcript_12329/g.23950 Transcript_12329/m.23950 type:complete len:211 (-) Transcript_12329:644-1276(-)